MDNQLIVKYYHDFLFIFIIYETSIHHHHIHRLASTSSFSSKLHNMIWERHRHQRQKFSANRDDRQIEICTDQYLRWFVVSWESLVISFVIFLLTNLSKYEMC